MTIHTNETSETNFEMSIALADALTLTRCSKCDAPAHASETNDDDECASCTSPTMPAIYVRDIVGRPGCMMGDVAFDCVEYNAKSVAATLRDMLSQDEDESDDQTFLDNAIAMPLRSRVVMREASAYELSERLRDVLVGICGENVRVYYVNGGAL